MKLNRVGGSILARRSILENKPIKVKHALHAREPNRWVICFKANFLMKQGKDLQEIRGRALAEPPICDISTHVATLSNSTAELIS